MEAIKPRHYRLGDIDDTVVDLNAIIKTRGPEPAGGMNEPWFVSCQLRPQDRGQMFLYPTEEAARDAYKRLTLTLCGEES